jgi:hypothetical protein
MSPHSSTSGARGSPQGVRSDRGPREPIHPLCESEGEKLLGEGRSIGEVARHLEKIVADQALEIDMLKELNRGNY